MKTFILITETYGKADIVTITATDIDTALDIAEEVDYNLSSSLLIEQDEAKRIAQAILKTK